MARFSLLVTLLCACLVSTLDLTGKIAWNDVCPDIQSLGQAQAQLDNGRFKGSITRNGHFVIPNVPSGTYLLSVISHDFAFEQLRIDISEDSESPEVRPYVIGTPLQPPSSILLSYPINLVPRQKSIYFVPPESFNLVAMLSNPMMLLMVVGGGMMFALPYITKNLDPEALEELKEQQAKMSGIQNAMTSGDLKSGFSALMSAAADSQEPEVVKPAPSAKRASAKKARR